MMIGGLAAGAAFLAGRVLFRRSHQESAARAAGMEPVADMTHVPAALQKSALWSLADGGFERRLVSGKFSREAGNVEVTAFDLETLRERRGEWAWLPVIPPFRIASVVSVVVCDVDRTFPHVLFRCAGRGDEMLDDTLIEQATSLPKLARDLLGLGRSYAAELPTPLPEKPAALQLPPKWRGFRRGEDLVEDMLGRGLAAGLERASRRDLVIELIDRLI